MNHDELELDEKIIKETEKKQIIESVAKMIVGIDNNAGGTVHEEVTEILEEMAKLRFEFHIKTMDLMELIPAELKKINFGEKRITINDLKKIIAAVSIISNGKELFDSSIAKLPPDFKHNIEFWEKHKFGHYKELAAEEKK